MCVNHIFSETTNLLIWWLVKFRLDFILLSMLDYFLCQTHRVCTLLSATCSYTIISIVQTFLDFIHMKLWSCKIWEKLLDVRKLWNRYLQMDFLVSTWALIILVIRIEWLIQAIICFYVRRLLVASNHILGLIASVLLWVEMWKWINGETWLHILVSIASFGLSSWLVFIITRCRIDSVTINIAIFPIGNSTILQSINTFYTWFFRSWKLTNIRILGLAVRFFNLFWRESKFSFG